MQHRNKTRRLKRETEKALENSFRSRIAFVLTNTDESTRTQANEKVKINQSRCCCDLTLFTIITISFIRTHFLYIRLFTWMLYVSVDCNQNALWPCFIFSHYYFYCYCPTVGILCVFSFRLRRECVEMCGASGIFRLQRKVCARSSW